MLTPRTLQILQKMADTDEEIVADGLSCYVGEEATSRVVLMALLRHVAISDVSDSKGIERYVINSIGRGILARPELAQEVRDALNAGRSVTLDGDRLVDLGTPEKSKSF